MPSFQLENGPVIEWKDSNYVVVGGKWKSGFLGGGEWEVRWKKPSMVRRWNFVFNFQIQQQSTSWNLEKIPPKREVNV